MVRIGEAAKAFGVSAETVRRWEIGGKITAERTPGGQRRYDLSALLPDKFSIDSPTRRTVTDARVSSHDQSADLERQKQVLLNQGQDTAFEEDLATDVLEIITVFSARFYGSRSHKNKKMLDNIKPAVADSQS